MCLLRVCVYVCVCVFVALQPSANEHSAACGAFLWKDNNSRNHVTSASLCPKEEGSYFSNPLLVSMKKKNDCNLSSSGHRGRNDTVTIPQAFSSTYFSSSKFHCKTSAADLSAHTYNIYQNMQNNEWCVMSFGKDPQNYV